MSDIKIDISTGKSYVLRPGDSITIKNNNDEEAWREEYRKKQAAGVKYEGWNIGTDEYWRGGNFNFTEKKEDYREAQEDPNAEAAKKWAETWNRELSQLPRLEEKMFPDQIKDYAERLMKINADFLADTALDEAPKPTIPHLAERKLWLAQREGGTNEAWQWKYGGAWCDIDFEPKWTEKEEYRVKPKTVKRYMAMLKDSQPHVYAFMAGSPEEIIEHAKKWNITIIGDIVERDVSIEQ